MQNFLERVESGMRVYDRTGEEIGKVESVKFTDEDPTTPDAETVQVSENERDHRDSIIGNIADVFRPDELPEALRNRLLREGFVRIDADGLFAADRYVLPDQIQSVTHDGLRLNVSKDELIKRH